MTKTIIITAILSIFSTLQVQANTPFRWCMTELIIIRDQIQTISPDAIEIVDGYNDLESIENVDQCEMQLSEAEGILTKVCLDREKLNISEGFEVYINKESHDACKAVSKESSFQNEIERFSDTDPSIRLEHRSSGLENQAVEK